MGIDDKRVTITAIAHAAGVSVPTVSRVLNGRSDVAPQTRRRIEELLRQHGYRSRAGRHGRRTSLVDLVFHDIDSPWAMELIRGVEQVAQDAGVGTVVSAVHGRSAAARQWLQTLRERSSDGVILVTSEVTRSLHAELRRLDIAVVVVDPAGHTVADVPTVGATNWAGGLSATEHLVTLGHRRIGFIAGPERLRCSRARFDGYRAGLEAVDQQVSDSLVRRGDFCYRSGLAAAASLLALDEPPTAVFASNDLMAFGVHEAARHLGLRVPDDLSVVGFDDLPQARWSAPPLTTVRQPLIEMGGLAARTVLRLARGEPVDAPQVELATTLVVRQSTAPPAAT